MPVHPDALNGIRLKLRRGWDQLEDLKSDIKSFLGTRPYRPVINFDPKSKVMTVKVVDLGLPDPMWSVRVGEIVHDFRSALDHLVWELAGRPSPRAAKTQFPIFESQAGFEGRGVEQFLKGVTSKVIELIRSEQPFHPLAGGEEAEGHLSPVWHLKELNDIDKHRTLHLAVSTLESHQFKFPPVIHAFQTANVREHTWGATWQRNRALGGNLDRRVGMAVRKQRD